MSLRRFILCHLSILSLAGISQKAIANPDSNVKPSNLPQWSDQTQTQPRNSSQWVEQTGVNSTNSPQWFDGTRTNPTNAPQWSNSSPSPQWESPLPHLAPSMANFRPKNEVVADNNQSNPTTVPEDAQAEPSETPLPTTPESETPKPPLTWQQPTIQPTAQHLLQGDVTFNFYNRLFFPPGSVEEGGTAAYPNVGFSWGITDNLELTLEIQFADSGSPGRQGDFEATRDNTDVALELKQRLWQNSDRTQSLSAVLSLSAGSRGFKFKQDGVIVDSGKDPGIVPALQFPFTASVGERWQFTISPTIAFFQEDSAILLHRPPIDDPGSFGTTFGFVGAISLQINPRLMLWGDAFIPITGNNSISRDSGKPDTAIAFNAGLRYLVNPRLALDIFASNTLGSVGPLSLTADRDYTAVGAGLVFMPDFFGTNYPDSFSEPPDAADSPLVLGGLGFFDGGTVPSGSFAFNLQGGSQGLLTALRFGILRDLEIGIYLDYISGDVDESEQGISGKIRLLNQAAGDPFTASLVATVGQTNQPFVNFINDNRREFKERDLDKTVPWLGQGDDLGEGRLYVTTLSLPLHYQFGSGIALWFTPIWGYVQRNGTEIAGFNTGGSFPIVDYLSLIGEVGVNFIGEGNAFIGSDRDNVIPWNAALRWDLSGLLGLNPDNPNHPQLELYVTNRVGFSPWHQLRVRDQNETAVGVGVLMPF